MSKNKIDKRGNAFIGVGKMPMTSKIIMTKGLPGSGKTTWAKEFILEEAKHNRLWKRINKDELREMLDAGRWSKQNEWWVLEIRDLIAENFLMNGFNVIIDDTNLAPKHEQKIKEIARYLVEEMDCPDLPKKERHFAKIEFEIKDFTDVPLNVCIERDKARAKPVGEKVIKQMFNQFLKPATPPIQMYQGKPFAIICDIDGTIALGSHRGPFEFEKCHTDEPNQDVIDLVNSTFQRLSKNKVLFVSGREAKYRAKTRKWIAKYIDFPKEQIKLFMRKTGDFRKDYIVKKEIYEAKIKGKYNIKFVLDDRNQVVNMWREVGLTCLQVADGDF